ncbi:alpha/beta hydrolase fold domain-containing protein [Nonomuraea longicatena]|uniref:Alpha/beta hydrolase fold domain-containing protein n=1 Tax=Nonomuraea longicatena TaxID=83682 RepID=A0ABP4A7H3_9ACTN
MVGPGVIADRALLSEVAEHEFGALGVPGTVVHVADARALGEAIGDGVCVVAVPGPQPEVRALMAEEHGPVVWLDLARDDGISPGVGATHLHGRGIAGLTWAIRHALHRLDHPSRRIPYGRESDQWGDLYLPDEAGPLPVIALVHGGYWRSVWAADLMEALAADLVGRGFAVWNLEYRRPDLHGWDATVADLASGLAALAGAEAPLDLDRVAVAGHSAGGQLALRAAADGARVALAVSLAGVADLAEGDRRWLSSGAVAAALGGPEAYTPGVYGAASPLARLPLKVRQLIVQGSGDDLDLVDFSRRYARAAAASGDVVTYLEMSGDHFAVIDPATPIWRTTAVAISDALR